MPTSSTFALGRLARKLVNESLIVQMSGRMLMASNSSIVGPTKSQVIARSERPRMRVASAGGVAAAMVVKMGWADMVLSFAWTLTPALSRKRERGKGGCRRQDFSHLEMAAISSRKRLLITLSRLRERAG